MIHLTNKKGSTVLLTEYGAGIVSIVVPDRYGRMDDIVLGYRNEKDYRNDAPCCGKIPGRFANRIAGGRFSLDGKTYHLETNNGPNHLHGGSEGFSNRCWEVSGLKTQEVTFHLCSPDGDQGYPGRLEVGATYSWSDENILRLELKAVCDRTTILNLTSHVYWNLSGENSGGILDHQLQLFAGKWLPTDETLIPTGELASVEGTPMDFRTPKKIGKDISADFEALKIGKGYDSCWVIDGEPGIKKAAVLSDSRSGRILEIRTDQPGVQIYTGNWLAGSPVSKSGRRYNDYDGIAIECQNFPDAPNKNYFPSAILKKGEIFHRTIEFHLSAE